MSMTPMELTGAIQELQQRLAALETVVGVDRGKAPPAPGAFDPKPDHAILEGSVGEKREPPQPPEAGQGAETVMIPPPAAPVPIGDPPSVTA